MTPNLSGQAGRRLRDDLREPESSEGYAALRQRLVLSASAERSNRARRRRLALAGTCIALLLVLGLFVSSGLRRRDESGLAFYAGEAGDLGRVGAYYAASADAPLLLRFVEGSKVQVDRGGGLRVSGARSARVSVQLETGAAQFDVVPRRDAEWDVLAGPYRVRVTGTSFWLAWDAEAQALDLRMQSGSVIVSGPGIEHGQRVRGTERFVTRVSSSRSNALANGAPPRVSEAEPVEPPAPAAPASAATTPPLASAELLPEPARRPGAPKTPAAIAAERRRDALAEVEAVERGGTERFLSSAGAEQLLSLADSARFARKGELAARALRAVRARFGGSRAAASAAFLLGRMAEDAGQLAQAVSLYDAHAQESGELVPEALGRKMLALHRLGETARRDRVASEYLERFPKGSYAPQARELLSR